MASRNLRLTAPQPSEAAEQTALLGWAMIAQRRYPVLRWLLAIPNGLAASSVGAARRMKEQGMKAGVPDLFLPAQAGGYAGLWIEMKRRDGGKVSKAQAEWHQYLALAGYKVVVCHGWAAAANVIDTYLNEDKR